MTTVEEQVAEEQAAYEAENEPEPVEPEPDEPEPEPEPEPETPPQVGFTPEQLRKADRAIDAHRKKMGEILSAEYVANQCLMCAGVGAMPEVPAIGTEFAILEEAGSVVFVVKPPAIEPEYLAAPDKAECPECAGLGMVTTGARTEHGRVAPCGKCAGNGWVVVARDAVPQTGAVYGAPVAPITEQAASLGLGPDAWGRAAGHPHWGVPPAQIPG